VVSTHLKNISQNENLPQIGVKIEKYVKPPPSCCASLGVFWEDFPSPLTTSPCCDPSVAYLDHFHMTHPCGQLYRSFTTTCVSEAAETVKGGVNVGVFGQKNIYHLENMFAPLMFGMYVCQFLV